MNRFNSLLLVREGEGRQVIFYLLLFACLGAGMAVGKGSADAMFLKRYGIEYLPVMYLILSAVLAVTFIAYAAFVDRIAPEKFFYTLLFLQVITLILFWFVIVNAQLDVVYPAYYILYELISDLILVHAAFYIGHNLNTLQSKRLMPLVFAGYQLGMIVGGVVLAVIIPAIGVNHAVLVWAVFAAAGLLLLTAWHKKHGASAHFVQPSRLKVSPFAKAIYELKHGLRFMQESSLLKNASLALFFMVIMFYALTFSVNKIYSEHFQSENELTAFFGLLLAAANVVAILLQIFIASRFIDRFGVSKTKLVFPLTSIIAFVMLLLSPGFYTAILASFNKDSIMPAFRNPTRQMFFNVLPDYMQGRARASSVALVLPLALFVCGILIWKLQHVSGQELVIALGLFCAVMYLIFCSRMGRAYVEALIDNLKEKLYLPKDADYVNYRSENKAVYQVLLDGLNDEDNDVCLSYARLLIQAYPDKAVDAILQRSTGVSVDVADQLIKIIGEIGTVHINKLLQYRNDKDDHYTASIYSVIFSSKTQNSNDYIEQALQHQNPRVQVTGIRGAIESSNKKYHEQARTAWQSLLDGDIAQMRTVIELIPLIKQGKFDNRNMIIDKYAKLITHVLKESDDKHRITLYYNLVAWQWELPQQAQEIIRNDVTSLDVELRCAVVSCLFMLGKESDRQTLLWKALGDGHAKVRRAAISALNKHLAEPENVYYGWMLINKPGSSRAQAEVMKHIIRSGVVRDKLTKIVDAKIRYAADILSVINQLDESDQLQSAAEYVLRQALEERLMQTLDLALMALEPEMDHEIMTIIRAGINSKDKRQQANAREALQSFYADKIVNDLNCLIEKDYKLARNNGLGRAFPNIREALEWCANGNDFWLSECGARTLRNMGV